MQTLAPNRSPRQVPPRLTALCAGLRAQLQRLGQEAPPACAAFATVTRAQSNAVWMHCSALLPKSVSAP